jgi:hypothetical protein
MLLSALTRHWTISGASHFQSGAYSTVNFLGLDSNGDGSTANDRPFLVNSRADMSSVGIDGGYLDPSLAGTYFNLSALNNNQLLVVDPTQVHWLIPITNGYDHREIGRNNYLNPGSVFNDVALEKAIPTSFLRLERGSFVLRAEAQNIANHNNVGLLDVNLLDVGTPFFTNTAQARSADNRALRFWAKFVF